MNLERCEEFLGEKVAFEKSFGFHVNALDLHAVLNPDSAGRGFAGVVAGNHLRAILGEL